MALWKQNIPFCEVTGVSQMDKWLRCSALFISTLIYIFISKHPHVSFCPLKEMMRKLIKLRVDNNVYFASSIIISSENISPSRANTALIILIILFIDVQFFTPVIVRENGKRVHLLTYTVPIAPLLVLSFVLIRATNFP
jgi:hypothetical protein